MTEASEVKEKVPLMPLIVAIALGLCILISFYVAGTRQLSETESVLLGVLLSAASILVSWLITHVYSQISLGKTIEQATESNKENIKNYAVKAAEKVLNLSGQLKRLSEALSNAIEDSDDLESHKEAIMLLQERISSAVHNIETLRSMNDTFLSDWRGVIGEEIEKQQVLENQINNLSLELETLKKERDTVPLVSQDRLSDLESLISETESRIIKNLSDLPFKVTAQKEKPKKREVTFKCIKCSNSIETKIRLKKGGKKLEQCENCNQYLKLLVLDDHKFRVSLVNTVAFNGPCPLCTHELRLNIAEFPGATGSMKCLECDIKILISRTQDDFNVKPANPLKRNFSQKIIDSIRAKLPAERPWPIHIHKQIALDLGYSKSLVSKVISKLISEGLYPNLEGEGKDENVDQSNEERTQK